MASADVGRDGRRGCVAQWQARMRGTMASTDAGRNGKCGCGAQWQARMWGAMASADAGRNGKRVYRNEALYVNVVVDI
jgi:hypothetical protein